MVGIRAKIGEKGQVVIPKPLRDKFKLDMFTEIVFDEVEGNIIIKKEKSGLDILEEYFNEAKKFNIKIPKNVDWNAEHYSQFD